MRAALAWLGAAAIAMLAITAAIMAAAPYLALGIVVACFWAMATNSDDDGSDKQEPPQ